MSYAAELAKISRTPQTVFIATLDYCSRTFGVAPCTATGTKCYNTRSTCKDVANYNKTTKDYKFSLKSRPLPFPGEIVRPYMAKEPEYLPTEIDPKKALTANARVTVELYDEPDTDVGIDPYLSSRSSVQGTFWRKWLARNKYYFRRPAVLKKGFHGLSEADYKIQKFILESIEGPNKGSIKLILKDLLKRADSLQVPKATAGKITDNPLTSGAATINCNDTSEYPAAGVIRIDDEIIPYAAKTSTSFTSCTRGAWGTTAAEHSYDTKIQLCYAKQGVNGIDIIQDILENEIGMDTADIDTAGFADEKNIWGAMFNFTGIVSKPMKASEILQELCECMSGNVWWSDEEQLVKFKIFAPFIPSITPAEWTDANSLIEAQTNNNEESRISRVVCYFNKNHAKEDNTPESYGGVYIVWNVDAEGADMYNEPAIKTIYSRWTPDSIVPKRICTNYLRRFLHPPKKLEVQVELKDGGVTKTKIGEIVNIQSSKVQDIDGSAKHQSYQVVKKQQKSAGKVAYTVLDTAWDRRYGFIAPAGYPDYDDATEAQRRYAFIGRGSDNKVYNGSEYVDGYYIW